MHPFIVSATRVVLAIVRLAVTPDRSVNCSAAFRSLVLFDIDGTLVRRAGAHHREALVQGVRRVTGSGDHHRGHSGARDA